MDVSHSDFFVCKSNILSNRTNIFRDKNIGSVGENI